MVVVVVVVVLLLLVRLRPVNLHARKSEMLTIILPEHMASQNDSVEI